jgi:hypothetical protein
MNKMYKKLFNLRILKRIYLERLGEPLLYNLVSLWILFFGNIKKKIEYDLIPRQPYAFGLNQAFKAASNLGLNKIIVIEFGVAQGAGLFNLADICSRLSVIYKLDYKVVGFDTGYGMPSPIDYRDHPEKYRKGDFPPERLTKNILPIKTDLIYGPIKETLQEFVQNLKADDKITFISIDVDYYSSTIDCFEIFNAKGENFLPSTILYFDDVNNIDNNKYMGELLAITEYNQRKEKKKICKMTQLKNWRIFKNAMWIDQMYFLHVLDADYRDPKNYENKEQQILENPYI